MLESINKYFNNIGIITKKNSANTYHLTFSGVSKCLIIQNHFDLFPLMTYKLVYYLVWCQILNIMQNNEHLTVSGFNKIIKNQKSMNKN